MGFPSYVWPALSACTVALTTASCVARLAALYRGPDIVVLVDGGGASLRALRLDSGDPTLLLSEFELDLEAQLGSWAAAPRVTARVSMAVGVLFAALSLRTVLDGASSSEEGTALVEGVMQAIAPMVWGIVGLGVALTTDRLARARTQELRRAAAQIVGLMCVPRAG